jgi:hypothetical protein
MPAVIALLPVVALFVAPLATPACVIPSISQNVDSGTAATAAASGDAGATTTVPAVQGASCTQITASISICQYISSCPTLVLNPQVFPQCGFRIHGDAIDPECLCGNYLCPIGVPTTCTEAATLASGDTTYDSVCQQSVEGHCTDLSAAGTTGTMSPSACQTCMLNCDNVPACVDACGC